MKIQNKGLVKQIQKEARKARSKGTMEFKWFGLAACVGETIYGIPDTSKVKKIYDWVKTEDELDSVLISFNESVTERWNRLRGKGEAIKSVEGCLDE